MRLRQRRSVIRANYHPILFTLMALTAAAELGLTAFLISAGNEVQTWASPNYHSLSVTAISCPLESHLTFCMQPNSPLLRSGMDPSFLYRLHVMAGRRRRAPPRQHRELCHLVAHDLDTLGE